VTLACSCACSSNRSGGVSMSWWQTGYMYMYMYVQLYLGHVLLLRRPERHGVRFSGESGRLSEKQGPALLCQTRPDS